MSRNGSGVYSLPAGNPVITGTVIASTWANNTLTDIASALTASIASDGQTPMVGDLDMNTNKIINLEAGTVAGDAVEYSQLASYLSNPVTITGGTINNTVIGGTTSAAGTFTTLNATTLNATTVNATTINGTVTSTSKLQTTNFTVEESGGKLVFKYGATTIASLSSTGVFTTLASNVCGGTP
jgi:hypothetical protein